MSGQINNFSYRLRRKWREHKALDPSGKSFIRYAFRFVFYKILFFPDRFYSRGVERYSKDTLNISVYVSGGLGDCIVVVRLLKQLSDLYPACRFHVFYKTPKVFSWVSQLVPAVESVESAELYDFFSRRLADCALRVNTFAKFDETRINVRKIKRLAPGLLNQLNASRRWEGINRVFVDNHPTLDGAYARNAVALGWSRHDALSRQLDLPPCELALELPCSDAKREEVNARFKRYVTVNTGFDKFFVMSTNTATKCYPDEYWSGLVRLLKETYPDLGVIQVGNGCSYNIPEVDLNLSGKTSLEECTGLLKGSALHLDIEGGLVHVCACFGTRCAVLFGPTSLNYFGYPGNINLRDNGCTECWWSTERWMECCPKNYPENLCMKRLTPERVLEAIRSHLEGTEKDA